MYIKKDDEIIFETPFDDLLYAISVCKQLVAEYLNQVQQSYEFLQTYFYDPPMVYEDGSEGLYNILIEARTQNEAVVRTFTFLVGLGNYGLDDV